MTYGIFYIGQVFNSLTIIDFSHSDKRGRKHFLCKCICGNEKIIQGSLMTSGNTKSCGCWGKIERKIRTLLPNNGGIVNHLILLYKRHAKNRGIFYGLDRSDFNNIIREPCFYCGIAPSNFKVTRNCKEGFRYNGIDRVDSKEGYILDNSVPCCIVCNRAKNNMPKDDFLAWVKRTFNHQSIKNKQNTMKQKIKVEIHKMGSENDFITRLVASVNSGKAQLSMNSLMGYIDTRQAVWSDISNLSYKQSGNRLVISEDGNATFTLSLEWVEVHELDNKPDDLPQALFSGAITEAIGDK